MAGQATGGLHSRIETATQEIRERWREKARREAVLHLVKEQGYHLSQKTRKKEKKKR